MTWLQDEREGIVCFWREICGIKSIMWYNYIKWVIFGDDLQNHHIDKQQMLQNIGG